MKKHNHNHDRLASAVDANTKAVEALTAAVEALHSLAVAQVRKEEEAQLRAVLDQPIETLDLMIRSYNVLKREGIHTLGQLIELDEFDLLEFRNFGQTSLNETKQTLAKMGLHLNWKVN